MFLLSSFGLALTIAVLSVLSFFLSFFLCRCVFVAQEHLMSGRTKRFGIGACCVRGQSELRAAQRRLDS